jgi:hypothetical protein
VTLDLIALRRDLSDGAKTGIEAETGNAGQSPTPL